MRKRILSLMLCCVMLLGLMPTTAFAAGGQARRYSLAQAGFRAMTPQKAAPATTTSTWEATIAAL